MSWIEQLYGCKGQVYQAKVEFDNSEKKPMDYARYANVCYQMAQEIKRDIMRVKLITGFMNYGYGHGIAKRAIALADKVRLEDLSDKTPLRDSIWMLNVVCCIYHDYGHLCGILGNGRKDEYKNIVHIYGHKLSLQCRTDTSSNDYVRPYLRLYLRFHIATAQNGKLKTDVQVQGIKSLIDEAIEKDCERYTCEVKDVIHRLRQVIPNRKARRSLHQLGKKVSRMSAATA